MLGGHRFLVSAALVAGLALCLLACRHVTHPAHVTTGFQTQVAAGVVKPTYRSSVYADGGYQYDPVDYGTDVQLALGYGHRWTENIGGLFQLTMPLTRFDGWNGHYGNASQSWGLPGLDLYLQLLGGPVNAGIGALVSADLGGYLEVGSVIPTPWSGLELSVNGGAKLYSGDIGWSPFVLVFGAGEFFLFGLWGEAHYYPSDPPRAGDDPWEVHAVSARYAAGLVAGLIVR